MFRPRGIFFKYMASFLLIIVIIFSVLTATVSVIVNSYGTNMKTETLSNAANSAAVYVKNDYDSEGHTSFKDYLSSENKDLTFLLDLLSVNDQSQLMFLTDKDGEIIRFGGSENITLSSEAGSGNSGKHVIPESVCQKLSKGEHV